MNGGAMAIGAEGDGWSDGGASVFDRFAGLPRAGDG